MTWTELKSYIKSKGNLRFIESTEKYDIWVMLDGTKLDCEMEKETPATTDQVDFETNYKSFANINVYAVYEADGSPLKVSSPIMKTQFFIDDTEVSHDCTDTVDTLFKTWNFSDSYLKGLAITIEKKETIVKILLDDIEIVNINILNADNVFNLLDTPPLAPLFDLYLNDVGVYVLKLGFDNTPFNEIELKLRNAEVGTRSLKYKYGVVVYNKVYTK
jgi:hypothetical protein